MILEAVAAGKTLEEAQEAALLELKNELKSMGVNTDGIEYEVLSLPQKKTFGLFGGTAAKVRVYKEVADKTARALAKTEQPAKKPEKAADKNEKRPAKQEKMPVKRHDTVADGAPKPAAVRPHTPAKASMQLDEQQKQRIVDYLQAILVGMGVENAEIDIESDEDGTRISFDGDKLGVAIGRKGETLDSLQHLVSLAANRKAKEFVRITLNPGGYRQKRTETLTAVAQKSAQQAVRLHKNIVLEPMNSYERRIVHNAVQEIEGIESWSIGEDDRRRVCIGTDRNNKSVSAGGRYDRRDRGGSNGRYDRRERGARDNTVEPTTTREPKKDNETLPKYGIIK